MSRTKDVAELREFSVDRLHDELKTTRAELFQNRVRYATRNLDHPEPIRKARKRVARLLTLIGEKERAEAGGTK